MATYHIATMPCDYTWQDLTSNFEALNKKLIVLDSGEEVEIGELYQAYQTLAKTGILIESEVDKAIFYAIFSVIDDEGFVLTSLETQENTGDILALVHMDKLNEVGALVSNWESDL